MTKALVYIIFIFWASSKTYAQDAPKDTTAYGRYLDLNVAMLEGDNDNLTELVEQLMPDTARLPAKVRVSFYNMAGKVYEDEQPVQAIAFYNKVAAAAPDYYVVHRALGYLYLKQSQAIELKLSAARKELSTDAAYVSTVKKALPHLEKAQACDPSGETMQVITSLYKKIKDSAGLSTLSSRMAAMEKSCIDILDTE